jgi:bifunctional DNase/RNase
MASTEVQVFGVIVDEATKSPVVILRAVEGDQTLPIQVGLPEAGAIAAAIEKVEFPRPMTHDLAVTLATALGARIERVEVVDLREGTFFAVVTLLRGRRRIELDSRPSDAIALALRAKAPIHVADEVFRKVEPQDVAEATKQGWMAFLHSLEASRGAGEPAGGKKVRKDLVQ